MYQEKIILLIAAFVVMASCSTDNDELTAEQSMSQKLQLNTWKIANVQVDGADRTSLFNGFTIKFNEIEYTTTGTTPVWPRSGTWQFVAISNAKVFTRDDSIEVTIESITDNSLVLSLTWNNTSFGGGRSNSIAGKHIFIFSK